MPDEAPVINQVEAAFRVMLGSVVDDEQPSRP
jgi:hypothetical protein